ncbi:MAG: hypothetical protein H6718_13110 [Polyangiaceae bacterium]|nr:hypothetical protein [Myxococcales bacterium]MCB9586335.1 hypothetical protein [Polyangiaceae bacterium]MCB9607012.1 hypothetical protein [Polyangiaceae bacterium]
MGFLFLHADVPTGLPLELNAAGTAYRLSEACRVKSEVVCLTNLEFALVRLDTQQVQGLIADLRFPGVREQLTRIRADWPLLPLLLVVPTDQPQWINLAHPLRAQCLLAPLQPADVRQFIQHALSFCPVEREELDGYLSRFGQDYELTTREHALVAAGLEGVQRSELLARFRISENTLKSQVRGLLRKTGQASMDALMRSVLRDVLSQQVDRAPLSESESDRRTSIPPPL